MDFPVRVRIEQTTVSTLITYTNQNYNIILIKTIPLQIVMHINETDHAGAKIFFILCDSRILDKFNSK